MYSVEMAEENTILKKANFLSYVYVNFCIWDFSSVEFIVFCKVNLCLFSKTMSYLRLKIPVFTL